MVAGRCSRHDCEGFAFDDADHVEDAIQKLRAHFRMDHPTKAFYEQNALEDVEQYNLSLDEQVSRYTGINDWRNMEGLQPRHVVAACQQMVRNYRHMHPDVIAGAIALAREHGTEIPDPEQAAAEAAADPNRARRLAEVAQDIGIVFDDEPFGEG